MQEKGLPDVTGMEFPLELPIFIPCRPSMRVCLFNTLVHAGAIFCLVLADLPHTVTVLIGAGVLMHYGFYLKRFFSPEHICFKLDKGDRWQLLRPGRAAVDLSCCPVRWSTRRSWSCASGPGGRTRSCVLTRDNLDVQTLRRLRVRLRWPY